MTEGQRLALDQIHEVERVGAYFLEVLSTDEPHPGAGTLTVEVSVRCNYPSAPHGLALRPRERFRVGIRTGFPFRVPTVCAAHGRFADFPHVQWGSHLCLYLAPDTEWDPSDGMFGFLGRLDEWLRRAAMGELDPVGAPLHPPVAYPAAGHLVIPRADTPRVEDESWRGFAALRPVSPDRTDVVGWLPFDGGAEAEAVGAAILLSWPLTFFEFPDSVAGLLLALTRHGVSLPRIFVTLQFAALHSDRGEPLLVLIGAPMRGTAGTIERQQHLVAWRIGWNAVHELKGSLGQYLEEEELKEFGDEAEERFWEWAKEADVSWCSVREDRPEVTMRRDHSSRTSWLRGKAVAVWGCGALGGHVAEFVVRAGASRVLVADEAPVAPGVLVRQPFVDGDIGHNKAAALAERLQTIYPGSCSVEPVVGDLLQTLLAVDDWEQGVDLVIDCTASRSVLKKLERKCAASLARTVPVASLVVGPDGRQGLWALARAGHTGGPADVLRALKLSLLRDGPKGILQVFWPDPESAQSRLFQPEPGCSDITFVGSAADVASLAGEMLNQVAEELSSPAGHTAAAGWIVEEHQDDRMGFQGSPGHALQDPESGYQVRVSDEAWMAAQEWIVKSQRRLGVDVETGGVLYGQRDDASGVVWIDQASGPPLDSEASEMGFLCGTLGVAEREAELRDRTEETTGFVGMWHTHPGGIPAPSEEDCRGMARLLEMSGGAAARVVLLIVGGQLTSPEDTRAYVFSKRDISAVGSSRIGGRVRPLYPVRLTLHRLAQRGGQPLAGVARILRSAKDSIARVFRTN